MNNPLLTDLWEINPGQEGEIIRLMKSGLHFDAIKTNYSYVDKIIEDKIEDFFLNKNDRDVPIEPNQVKA